MMPSNISELQEKQASLDNNNEGGYFTNKFVAKRGWGPNKGSEQQVVAGLQNPGGSLNLVIVQGSLLKALESSES